MAKIVGHIDHIGYLYCSECVVVPPNATPGGKEACLLRVGDTHAEEPCEQCGRVLKDIDPEEKRNVR